MSTMPILVTVDGMDGVGKETTTNALQKRLESEGKKVKRFQFPDYDSMDGKLIRAIQMGTYGGGKDQSQRILDDTLLGALPYTLNRMLHYKKYNITWESMQEYDVILFDRNYTSNWLYHASKLLIPLSHGMDSLRVEKIMKWIELNYQMEIESTWLGDAAKADACFLNFFLYGTIDTARYLMTHREGKQMGDEIQKDLDLNERREEVQTRVRLMGLKTSYEVREAIEYSNYRLYQQNRYDQILKKWEQVCEFFPININDTKSELEEIAIYPTDSLVDVTMMAMEENQLCWNDCHRYLTHDSLAFANVRRKLEDDRLN